MNICLVGGIYGKGGARTEYLKITPETTLETGFREAGHNVTTLSHYDETDFSRFDVVHVHHLSYGALRLASDRSRVPFVFTPHATSHMCPGSLSRSRRVAMRYVLASADALVSLSQLEERGAKEAFSLDGASLAAIPNGIDATQYTFRRDNRAGNGAPWQLFFSAQLIPIKRVDVLLRAVSRLRHNVELSMVYQNPQLEQDLKALAVRLGIADRVHFLGKVDPLRLAGLYQRSDVLVLPSETEALPSVITEAMLCGLPFVASAVGGIPEQAAGFGMVLDERSEDDIVAAITHVLDHYPQFADDSERMSQYAREKFSIPSMVNRHLELYECLLKELAGRQPRRSAARLSPLHAVARAIARRWGTAGAPPPQRSVSSAAALTERS